MDTNDRWSAAGNRDEEDFSRFSLVAGLSLRRGGAYVDVGAHRGRYLTEALRQGASATYAIEANPGLVEMLSTDFPTTTVVHAALSDFVGQAEFHVVNYDGLSSLRERLDLPYGAQTSTVSVPVRTGDSVLGQLTDVALVKIDVEGAENGVLRGLRRTIQRCRPVLFFEMGPTPDNTQPDEARTAFLYLRQLGYRLHTVDGHRIDDADMMVDIFLNWPIWNFVGFAPDTSSRWAKAAFWWRSRD